MSDLVERLRESASDPMWADFAEVSKPTLAEAADEITRLRQQLGMPLETERENARLRAEVEALRADAERLDWLDGAIFMSRWNGVIDSGSQTTWQVAGDFRHTTQRMVGDTLRAAIDAARKP